jgi:hypothetical protein
MSEDNRYITEIEAYLARPGGVNDRLAQLESVSHAPVPGFTPSKFPGGNFTGGALGRESGNAAAVAEAASKAEPGLEAPTPAADEAVQVGAIADQAQTV